MPIEEIPFADIRVGDENPRAERPKSNGPWGSLFAFLAFDLCLLHAWLIFTSLGGYEGLTSPNMIWRDDHPLYYHSALVTRAFLDQSGTTAGYDPSFMSGYAKSVIFPSSSTLPELALHLFRSPAPEVVYKCYVLVGAALAPFLIALAAWVWRLSSRGAFLAVLLWLAHAWGDFPVAYVGFGMIPYFLAVPLALLAAGLTARYLEHGGFFLLLVATAASAATLLCHPTTAMIVVPALGAAYLVASFDRRAEPPQRIGIGRHLGFWLIPVAALALNAFWWLPGFPFASTKGASDFAFKHDEGVLQRLSQIFLTETPTQMLLIGLALPGLAALTRRSKALAVTLVGFAAAGFGWGYLAGGFRSLDFLQPGRHTYAFYSALAILAGMGLEEVFARLKGAKVGRLDLLAGLGLALVGFRLFVPLLDMGVSSRVFGKTFLSGNANAPKQPGFLTSRPPSAYLWISERVEKTLRPGERLLYEEGGFDYQQDGADVRAPFGIGRFSGLIPTATGVELIGGPYLHASLNTNFTQFGEGKMFGLERWGRDEFTKYARLYRPRAIFCWSPRARAFCKANPDLIRVVDENGPLLFGLVEGFEGDTIQGSAKVEAKPGRLTVRDMKAGVDGLVVLRYHSVPCLRVDPPCPIEEVRLGDDPVPFIGLRPGGVKDVAIEAVPPPISGLLRKSSANEVGSAGVSR